MIEGRLKNSGVAITSVRHVQYRRDGKATAALIFSQVLVSQRFSRWHVILVAFHKGVRQLMTKTAYCNWTSLYIPSVARLLQDFAMTLDDGAQNWPQH